MSPVQFRQKSLAKMKDTLSKELGT